MRKSSFIECKFLPFEVELAPYGSVARATQDNTNYYLQCGFDEINWVPLEKILVAFHEQNGDLYDKSFIETVLKKYSQLNES